MSETVLIKRHDGDHSSWIEMTLNKPDRLNALDEDMHKALHTAFKEAAADDIRAVLLTGAGRGFCAGQDLGARDPRSGGKMPDLAETLRKNYNPTVLAIREAKKPVICAVNGVAAGAGANIALSCDIVLAASSARFIQAFAKLGLLPDAGGTYSLTHLVGPMRAKALAMTAEPIDAVEAERMGLVWRVYDDDSLMDEARKLTETLANGATKGLAEAKTAIHKAVTASLEEQLEWEADAQSRCGKSEDYIEGVAAFLEKRTAVFKGK
jgi:2-(1,2-epoxy-1,2-dihydrophenyl)acetyl-CoA isomerase